MRALLSLSLASLLVAAGLAGCASGDEPAGTEPLAETPAEEAPAVDDGTEPMSEDLGHMPHLHDYWQGKERVTIMDEEVGGDTFDTIGFTFFDLFMGTPGVGGAFFQLPEGSLVYEGTGEMEIVASWTDPAVTGVGLRYRTPASESFSDVLPLAQGTPVTLPITPDMTDMPHDKESRWRFLLVPAAPGQVIAGKVRMHLDILRMGDITLFPGHPELFQGQHTLTLFEGAAQSSSQNFATRIAGFMTDNQRESGVRASKVVPMETLSMTANVTIKSATSNVGSVSNITFLYKPAGTFRFERAQVLSADPAAGVLQFGWPVDMQQTDSPYAKESQWRFDLLIRTDPGTGQDTQGLADAQVDYDLVVVAYDALADGIEPPADEDDGRSA